MRLFTILFALVLASCSTVKTDSVNILRGPASLNELEKFEDDIILISSECRNVAVNMVGGKILNNKGDPILVGCSIKEFSAACQFLDEKGKSYASREMFAGISGQEGVVSTKDSSDVFIINMVTKKFYTTSNLYLEHGTIRGSKICTGDFLYKREAKKLQK